ncbi:MAG: protein kinase [Polyangiaceae bacterium]
MNDEAIASLRGSPVKPGTWLKEKWHIDALLGVGGVGSVYSVTHRNKSRAAIKVLHSHLASDPDLVARFLHEGYAANTVGHPGVVQVLDDDRTGDGLVFLVMELLDGETLEQHAHRRGGKLPVAEALPIAFSVLAVLAAAHEKGIIHRDLKTENIFLCRDGAVKVLDFGLARMAERAGPPRSGTQLGSMMGTPGFMPPEQVRGRWDQVDARSDLWALGATLYCLLSGRRVHESDTANIDVVASATRAPESLRALAPDCPAPVIAVVDRSLHLAPTARFQTAAEMSAALEKAASDSGLSARFPARGTTVVSVVPATTPVLVPPAPPPPVLAGNTEPIQIAPGTYWVGMRDPRSIFHANPYLRVYKSGTFAPYNLLIDPGSSSDFAVVSAKVSSVAGRLADVSGIFINHQDPDVGSSTAQITGRYAPRADLYCSEATWRLVVHSHLPRERFVDTDAKRRGVELPTGHRFIPVPSPFCHFRGAVMLYDPETRVLFSGDLLGGLSATGPHDLWAEPHDWSGVRAFHQAYMPTNRALVAAVRAIRRLDPPVEIIAPQHGRLLRGPLLHKFLDQLEKLPVGLDILDDLGDEADALAAWTSALNRVLHVARMVMGDDADTLLGESDELRERCASHGNRLEVKSGGRWVLGEAVRLLTTGQRSTIANPIRLQAVHACEELELPSPDLALEGESPMSA